MRILGIDPGSHVTGVAVIEVPSPQEVHKAQILVCGVLQLKGNFYQRLSTLSEELELLLKRTQPHALSLEKVFLGKNPDSAFKLGHARGVIIERAVRHQMQIHEYSTREIKKSIAGTGAADKLQVAQGLSFFFQSKFEGALDSTDALACALHHALVLLSSTAPEFHDRIKV